MRTWIAMLLLAATVGSLAGCSGSDTKTPPSDPTKKAPEVPKEGP